MLAFTTLCPAKLNLGLRVLGRRSDGYHELDTLFCQLDLADRLTVVPDGVGFELVVSGSKLDCSVEENLVTKAVTAYRRAIGKEVGGTWFLEKIVPSAAGLGGGSSDAAAALRLMQNWLGFPLSQRQLARVAVSVGSDVPFFLFGGLARGRGRGELLTQCEWPGKLSVVLVVQESGLSTEKVYGSLVIELTGQWSERSLEKELQFQLNGENGMMELANDLADPVYLLRPALRRLVDTLRDLGLSAVGVSGSGPTVFGLTRSKEKARIAAARLRSAGERVQITRLRRPVPPVRRVPPPQLEDDWGVVKR